MSIEKVCKKCGKLKNNFRNCIKSKDGYRNICNECRNERIKFLRSFDRVNFLNHEKRAKDIFHEDRVEIYLKENVYALIDLEDYGKIKNTNWNSDKRNYVVSTSPTTNKRISIHRCIFDFPSVGIDHKNRNPLDNRKKNLRIATASQNCCNKVDIPHSSKYRGVFKYKRKQSNKWRAHIRGDKLKIWLGDYSTELEAALAYNIAAIKYHGEFARLNEIAI